MTPQTKSSDATDFRVLPNLLNLYTDAGLILVPCAGFGRAIEQKGLFDKAFFDPKLKIRDCNYKMFLREHYVVIDVDPRNFDPLGDKPLSRLCQALQIDLKTLKDTFTVKTPSGGYHFYFSKSDRVKIRHSIKEYPGIEFLSHSITAAGSWNPEKETHYTILHKSPMQISKCPDILLALLAQPNTVDAVAEGLLDDHPVNVRRFIDFLLNCEPAIEGKGGDKRTFQVAAMGREMAITRNLCEELMLKHFNPRCEPEWETDALIDKINNAYEYGQGAIGSKSIENDFSTVEIIPENEHDPNVKRINWQFRDKENKVLKDNINNTLIWLSFFRQSLLHEALRFNLFSHRIEFNKKVFWHRTDDAWGDEDAIQAKSYLSVNKHYDTSTACVHEAAIVIASRKSYHPVREYLEKLVWDGTPRIDTWLHEHCGAPKTKYTAFVGRKTLIGAVSRVLKPGCKFDHALVLVGEQGTGKSFLCRTLAEPWFTDATLDIKHPTSAVEILQGNWIVELAEMDVLTKAESRSLKAFLSRQTDRMRPAYGRTVKDFPRQCIFIGTINPEAEGFLKDPTGNRRWWPVTITKVNIIRLRAERDQLWAEAYQAVKKGEGCFVDNEEMDRITRKEADLYQQEDPWTAIISDWIERHMFQFYDEKKFQMRIQVADIFGQCLGGNVVMLSAREAVRIATILKQLGFHKIPGNTRSTVYVKNLDQLI